MFVYIVSRAGVRRRIVVDNGISVIHYRRQHSFIVSALHISQTCLFSIVVGLVPCYRIVIGNVFALYDSKMTLCSACPYHMELNCRIMLKRRACFLISVHVANVSKFKKLECLFVSYLGPVSDAELL